ncbi:MAG: hypothetical protein QOH83_2162, partial [Solirubrobacteraceae bacterium]|nr:hypothetical protein [Solirubrobacteraceae bacterium]
MGVVVARAFVGSRGVAVDRALANGIIQGGWNRGMRTGRAGCVESSSRTDTYSTHLPTRPLALQ